MADNARNQMKIRPIIAAIASSMKPVSTPAQAGGRPTPFVTISRQAGAGAPHLADRLADALNENDRSERPWHVFDRELVEKVAADHQISQSLIDAMDESNHSWINDVLAGMKATGRSESTQFNVYRRVAETILGLAEAGKVVIVGRGAANICQAVPGGMHLRLVAPVEWRVEQLAKAENISESRAARRVRDLDENRESFYTRFWGKDALEPERYTVTFNLSRVSPEQVVQAVLSLMPTQADVRQAVKKDAAKSGR